MKLKFFFTYLSIFICLIFLTSCSTKKFHEGASPAVTVDSPSKYAPNMRMNSVAILNDNLQQWYYYESSLTGLKKSGKVGKIAVAKTSSERTEAGTLKAWALLRNRTDYPLTIQIRTHFFDKNKNPLGSPSSWQRIHLSPNAIKKYSEKSLSAKNVSFYFIEIKGVQ